jgi:hypothetical protein
MIFIELNMKYSQHVLVNSGFIEKFAIKEKPNYIFTSRSHWKEINFILPNTLNFIPIFLPVMKSGGRISAILKTIIESIYYVLIVLIAKLFRKNLIFLSAYSSTKQFIEFLCEIFAINAQLVHHGELNGLVDTSRRYSKFIKRYFARRFSNHVTDVFLSQSIAKNVFKITSLTPPCWAAILHPFPTAGRLNRVSYQKDSCIGYFGALSQENRKRLQVILDSLNSRVKNIGYQDFRFALLCPRPKLFDLGGIAYDLLIDTEFPLPQKEFVEHIRKFDLVILPYEHGQYDLIASGVIVECYKNGVKFLVTNSSFFQDWLEKYPESGEVFSSFQSLLSYIEIKSNLRPHEC